MANSFDVIAMLKANISDFKSGMKEAEGTLKEFQKSSSSTFQNIGNTVSGFGTALTVGVTTPLVAAGTKAYLMAADMEDALGATEQIFGSAANEVKSWANNLESYYGIAESEALEYSNTMGAMLKNIGGLSEQEAAKTSATLMELAGDLTAMYGGTVESAVQALTGALKGNNSMLDNYGMGVNEATIKLKAMQMGLIETGVSAAENERLLLNVEKAQSKYNEAVNKYGSESIEAREAANKLALANEKVEQAANNATGELTLEQKQAATLALIMEQTADAQGQAAREADGASGSMRALMTELKNLSTELGEVLLPIITPFIAKLRDMVAGFNKMSEGQKQAIVKFAMFAAALGPVLLVVGKLIAFIPSLIAGFKALGTVFAVLTGPMGWTVAAILAVVAAIIYLWNTNEQFRQVVMVVWEIIKGVIVAALGVIGSTITTVAKIAFEIWSWAWNGMKELVSGVLNGIVILIQTLLQTALGVIRMIIQLITGDWEGFWETFKSTIANAGSGVINAIGSVMQGAYDAVVSWFSNFAEAGANIVGMIADGIMGAIGKVTSAIGSVTSKIRAYLPFSPAKEGALRDIHRLNFGGTIADSIKRDSFKPIQAVSNLTKGIRSRWSNDVGRLQANVGGSVKRDIQTSVNVQNSGANSLLAQLLNREQYLVLDTGAFVGHTQHAYDVANGKTINLGKRVKR